MKDYNGFINENKKDMYKSREELDNMSKDEIYNIRHNILVDKNYSTNKKSQDYIKELSFYTIVRFKDDEYKRYQKWKDEKQPVVGKLSFDTNYKIALSTELPKDNKFKYITPMIFPDNIDMEDVYRLNQ